MSDQPITKEALQRLREQYPEGTRVELVSMDDPYTKLAPGEQGTVTHIDDTGTIFCRWDSGSGLGLVYGVDQFKKVDDAPARGSSLYETGADFWRDLKETNVSLKAAYKTGGNYIAAQLQREQPPDEHQFCRELFTAMQTDEARVTDRVKLVYPYDYKTADDRAETPHYNNSRSRNTACIYAIDNAIQKSCYQRDFYNLDLAAMKVIHDFGFERVNMALANDIGGHQSDGRFSYTNKQWAKGYDVNPRAFGGALFNSHAILIDGFATHTRKLYAELGAERFALPGQTESGETVQGYEIVRAVEFDNQRGFAIGLNPNAVNQFVTWQFTNSNGVRVYYWGKYNDEFADAALNYTARVIVHMSDEKVKEVRRVFDYEESTTENQPYTDLAKTAGRNTPNEKPSVMKRISDAQKSPRPPRREKSPNQHKNKGDIDL